MAFVTAYRELLGNRALARLLAGEFVSAVGDWLYLVALLVVVYRAGASPVVLGVVGAARVLPYVFLSALAGVVADRFDRRLVLLGTDLARGAVMLGLAALVVVDGPLVVIVALTILAACFSAFFGPALGAYLPALVRDERELGPANSAWATLENLAFIVGPAIAGLLIATGGVAGAFLLNAVSFAFVAVVLWRLPTSRPVARTGSVGPAGDRPAVADASEPPPAVEPPLPPAAGDRPADLRELLRRSGRELAGLAVVDVVGSFVFGGLAVLTVVIATETLRAGDAATGLLNAGIGIGGLVGALLASALVIRRSLAPPMLGGGLILGAGLWLLAGTTSLAVAVAAMAVAAGGSLLVEVVATTLFQRLVPDAVRGRALGILHTFSVAAYAVGSFALPVAAPALGVGPILTVCAGAVALSAVVGVWLVGSAARSPEVDPDSARFLALPEFAGLPPARLEAAARRLRPLTVRAGQVLIRQGDRPDDVYLPLEGAFGVDQADVEGRSRHLRDMGPGELFGELGLLARGPRTATVTALTDGRLLALAGDAFLDLVAAGPGLTSRLLELHGGAPGRGATD